MRTKITKRTTTGVSETTIASIPLPIPTVLPTKIRTATTPRRNNMSLLDNDDLFFLDLLEEDENKDNNKDDDDENSGDDYPLLRAMIMLFNKGKRG